VHSFLHITSKDIIKYDIKIHKKDYEKDEDSDEEEEKKEEEAAEKKKKEVRPTDLSVDEDHEGAKEWAEKYLTITCNPKQTIKNFKEKIKKETGKLIGTIHQAMFFIQGLNANMHYVLADKKNLYVYKDKKKTFFVKEDINMLNFVQISQGSNYLISRG